MPSKRRKMLDLPAFKEPAYTAFVLGGTLTFVSLNIPFFYIQYYAISNDIAADKLGFYLLSIITTGSVFRRIFPNIFANRIGPFNIVLWWVDVCPDKFVQFTWDRGDCSAVWILLGGVCLFATDLLCPAIS